jgi:hypothetical protein
VLGQNASADEECRENNLIERATCSLLRAVAQDIDVLVQKTAVFIAIL